jgi:hypothetical protein
MTGSANPWCSFNPTISGCCSVEEPFRSALIKAHVDHIRGEGVRLLKLDHNAILEMLRAPGVCSTEAISR